jgi:hypothetical protein
MVISRTLFAAAGCLFSLPAMAGLTATATYTDTQPTPGVYDYEFTLSNTGSTAIGTFWFSWIPGRGFMTAMPSAVTSPAGWSDALTEEAGTAIMWTTTSDALAPGQSLAGFSFESTETPAELAGDDHATGDPVTTSFVYIGRPFGDPGFQFAATALAAAPEPSTWALMLAGFVGLGALAFGRSRKASAAPSATS